MSAASQAGTALTVLAAIGAVVSLWRGAERQPGQVRHAYRWFASAAGLWGIGLVMAQVLAASFGAAAIPLSFADLPPLLAMLAMAAGLLRLAAPARTAAPVRMPWRDPGRVVAWLADGYVAASAMFLIGWVVLFGNAFAQAGTGPGAFTVEMVRPLADLALLGGSLPLVAPSGRRGLLPYLAAVAMTVGDSLAVSAQITGASPGSGATLAALVGFALLAGAPWTPAAPAGSGWWPRRVRSALRRPAGQPAGMPSDAAPDAIAEGSGASPTADGNVPDSAATATPEATDSSAAAREGAHAPVGVPGGSAAGRSPSGQGPPADAVDRDSAEDRAPVGQPVTVVVAAIAAALAAVSLIIWGIAGEPMTQPVVPLVAGTMVLTLAARILGLVGREDLVLRSWRDSRRQFRQLAERTSDAVLLAEASGVIRYASRAVDGYGYTPDTLRGKSLADLLHPEDRVGGIHAVRKALGDRAGRSGRYPCRVRAADGTWHHVETTVSRYREPGGRDHLLVTVRDISDQVALRRQVAHLTFHDGLTGLPNRAYVEQHARRADAEDGETAAPARVAGVIFLDVDRFTVVNDDVGPTSGDLLLAQVAHRLRSAARPQDTVARWGGDEFAVLVQGEAGVEEIIDIAEQLARGVAGTPFRVGERDVPLTASLGVALAAGGSAGYVWRNADAALTRAKVLGGGRVEVFGAAPREEGRGLKAVPDSETKLLSS